MPTTRASAKKDQHHVFVALSTTSKQKSRMSGNTSDINVNSPNQHGSDRVPSGHTPPRPLRVGPNQGGVIRDNSLDQLHGLTQSQEESCESDESHSNKSRRSRGQSRDHVSDADQPVGHESVASCRPLKELRESIEFDSKTAQSAQVLGLPSSASVIDVDHSLGSGNRGSPSHDGPPVHSSPARLCADDHVQEVPGAPLRHSSEHHRVRGREHSRHTSPHDVHTSYDSEVETSSRFMTDYKSLEQFGSGTIPLMGPSDTSNVSHLSTSGHEKRHGRDVHKRHHNVHESSQNSETTRKFVHGRNTRDHSDSHISHKDVLQSANDFCLKALARQTEKFCQMQEQTLAESLRAQQRWMDTLTTRLVETQQRDSQMRRDTQTSFMQSMMHEMKKQRHHLKRKKHERKSASVPVSDTTLCSYMSDLSDTHSESTPTQNTVVNREDLKPHTSMGTQCKYGAEKPVSSSSRTALSQNRVPDHTGYQSAAPGAKPKSSYQKYDSCTDYDSHSSSKKAMRDTHSRVPHGTHVGAPTSTHADERMSTHTAVHTTQQSSRHSVKPHTGGPTHTRERAIRSTHGGPPGTVAGLSGPAHNTSTCVAATTCTTTNTGRNTSMIHAHTDNTYAVTSKVQSGVEVGNRLPPLPPQMPPKYENIGIHGHKSGENVTDNHRTPQVHMVSQKMQKHDVVDTHGTTDSRACGPQGAPTHHPPVQHMSGSGTKIESTVHTHKSDIRDDICGNPRTFPPPNVVGRSNVPPNVSNTTSSGTQQTNAHSGIYVATKTDCVSFTRNPVLDAVSQSGALELQRQNVAMQQALHRSEARIENLNVALDVSESARRDLSGLVRDTFTNLDPTVACKKPLGNAENTMSNIGGSQQPVVTPRSLALQQMLDNHNAKTDQKFGKTGRYPDFTDSSDSEGTSGIPRRAKKHTFATCCNRSQAYSESCRDSTADSQAESTPSFEGGGEVLAMETKELLES